LFAEANPSIVIMQIGYLLCAYLFAFRSAHAFVPGFQGSVQSRFGKSHLARVPERQVVMQDRESSSRRALLAVLGLGGVSSFAQPSDAIWPFDKPEDTAKGPEVDREYLSSEASQASIAAIKELKSNADSVLDQLSNDKDADLIPVLAKDFDIQQIRMNVNQLFDAFDEETQDIIGGFETRIIDQVQLLDAEARFKKGKTTRGPKTLERVKKSFGAIKSGCDDILKYV
jgi:hypothetical protein